MSATRGLRLLAAGVAAATAGCASQGAPPGGPPDTAPPRLVRVTPDTNARGVKPRAVVFRFDEVIAERPAGSELAQLVVLSPSDGAVRVSWERNALTVRPRRGFRAGTAYTVTVLPGISDLRNNTARDGWSTTFTTGSEIPATRLDGVVYDWAAGRPAARAIVQAFARGDTSLAWTARTDSLGAFTIRAFPAGSYLVRAFLDANNNRALEPRELWDSAGAAIADSARLELYAFAHDTLGPRIEAVTVEDSVTLRVTVDRPLHPSSPLTAAQFRVVGSDSVAIAVTALLGDSAYAAERAARAAARRDTAGRGDSVRARAPGPRTGAESRVPLPRAGANRAARSDSVVAPRLGRPIPQTRIILRLAAPLAPARNYRVSARELRGLGGATRSSDRAFTTARPEPADTSATSRPAPRARPPR